MTERIHETFDHPAWTDLPLPPVQDFYLAVDLVALEIFSSMETAYIRLTAKQRETLDQAIVRSESLAMRRSGPLISQSQAFTQEEIAEREQILADFPDLNALTPDRLSQLLFEHPKAGILTAKYANPKWTRERFLQRWAIITSYLAEHHEE